MEVPYPRQLLERVKGALEALYSTMDLVGDEPALLVQFDVQIIRLRMLMNVLDCSSRGFLADKEMRRMQRAVGSRPGVLRTIVVAQKRVRAIRGLRESGTTRRKLVAFRRCVVEKVLPYELFVLIARWVTWTGAQ